MRILQLIDNLNAGGAEKMAFNYFISLKKYSEKSILVATREKGVLALNIEKDANFYFLNRKFRFDLIALSKLKKIIAKNNIQIVHAHGTSWFFAVLCKLTGTKFKLIWHDHYGNSEFLENRPVQPLKFFSRYFDGIISVNDQLKNWAISRLKYKSKIVYLLNFVKMEINSNAEKLKGDSQFKLICVANLRPQKDHYTLLKAFAKIKKDYSASLHLFGKSYDTDYCRKLRLKFSESDQVYYYGETEAVFGYLLQADLGVLSSKSEGLPLALIEYGLAGIPVVYTDVGDSKRIIGDFGRLSPSEDADFMAKEISDYLCLPEKMKQDGINLKDKVRDTYSEEKVIIEYLNFLEVI